MRRVLALAAALSAAAAAVSAAPITPGQHERDAKEQSAPDTEADLPADIDITGLRLGMTDEQVEAALRAHAPKLVLDWRGMSLGHFRFARAFLAAETPRWAAERSGDPTASAEGGDEAQEAYLVAFSPASGRAVAILRQFRPAAERPLVIDTTLASIKARYPFLRDNGAETNGLSAASVLLGGPQTMTRQCSNQRAYVVPTEGFQEQRLYGLAGFEPQQIRDPSSFDDALAALLANRFNSAPQPNGSTSDDPNWVAAHCGPVLAASVTPRQDDTSLVMLLTFHLYDLRAIVQNMRDLADRMRQGEAAFLRANADNKPPL